MRGSAAAREHALQGDALGSVITYEGTHAIYGLIIGRPITGEDAIC